MDFARIVVLLGAMVFLTGAPQLARAEDFYYGVPSVEIKVGDDVNISCRINPDVFEGLDSSQMYFIDEDTRERVPDTDVLVVNATTIVYMIRNATERMTKYLCKCGEDAIMETSVYVGAPPRPVRDFRCRGYDFEYMVCNFTQPENPVLTQYNLTYHFISPTYFRKATDECNFEGKPLVVCNITTSHDHWQLYHFTVDARNTLGTRQQVFTINYLDVVVPAQPGQDFNMKAIDTNAAEFTWRMPKFDNYKGLKWEVLLQPDQMPLRNLSSQVRVERSRGERLLNLKLTDLAYAFYGYDLHLRVKVESAATTEDMWSVPFVYHFQTAAKLPSRPPSTDGGSFYVNASRTVVRLYWEQLERQEYNGDNFTYVIRANEVLPDGGNGRQLLPQHMESNSAVFEWQADRQYAYEIRSRNHVGESLAASRIDIFPLTHRNAKNHTPRSIHNVYHATNGTYTLTWEAPVEKQTLRDYTVYWCYSKRALQTECKGSVHFRHISPNQQLFTTAPQSAQQEHTLNLAVSANYHNYNTGMHWTACTVDVNSDLVRMEPEAQATSATSIKVQWSSESVCPSILDGYNLTYCEVTPNSLSKNNSDNGTASESYSCVSAAGIDKNAKKFEIKQLKPYTLYTVEMFMYSRLKVGRVSEPLRVRTYEAAPTPPRQLHVVQVRNTSATIAWLPPSHNNGLIRQYIVKSNNKEYPVDATKLDPAEEITFELRNLSSYTAYKTFVIAQTIQNSDHSNDIHFTTHIGYPSAVGNIRLVTEGQTHTVQWNRPTTPSGRLEYYEVAVTLLRNDIIEQRHISAVIGGTSCVMGIPICPDYVYKTTVEVRAVNAAVLASEVPADEALHWSDVKPDVGSDDMRCTGSDEPPNSGELLQRYRNASVYRLYKSAWQPGPTYGCSASRLSKITSIALSVVMTTLFLVGLMFAITKKWNKMRNIKCTLPDGLDMYISKNGGGGLSGNGFVAPVEKEQQQAAVSPHLHAKESHNEKHHLLATQCNDSGYLGGGHTLGRGVSAATAAEAVAVGTVRMQEEDDEDAEKARINNSNNVYKRRAHLRSESSADSLVGSTDSGDGDMDEQHSEMLQEVLQLKQIAEEADVPYVEAPLPRSAPTGGSSGYIRPANLAAWSQTAHSALAPPPKPAAQVVAPASSGYVTVDSIPHVTKPAAPATTTHPMSPSGYVQPSTLPKLMTAPTMPTSLAPTVGLSGYTTLGQLSKMGGALVPNAAAQNPPLDTMPALPGISGYVTQRELNAFGQQQQHLY